MEEIAFSLGTVLGSSPAMDIDFMDELLLDGCWLETVDGSELFRHTTNFSTPFDNSLPLSTLDNGKENCSSSPYQDEDRGGKQTLTVHGESRRDLVSTQSHRQIMSNVEGFIPSAVCVNEGSELRRRWWIGPTVHPGTGISVMERLIKALGYIQDFAKDKDVLIQLWVPVNRGGNSVLTTHDQPFSLNPTSRRLLGYRDISVNYQFTAEKNSKELMGMPSRVFLSKVPEWTPDVRFFRSDEYPRVDHAQEYDVRGTLALPVFEQGSRTCLGVIEVVMTTQKVKYRPEIENVCKALEAVDLRSSELYGNQDIESNTRSYEAALPEIREVLRSACETHGLPLAQTWVPCIQQGKEGCRHSEENYSFCVSTVDDACHVADPHVHGFYEACSEHHLLKGQGVAGQAFLSNQPCFHPDITAFPKTEYPLSHHARMFGLHAAVAIRLRSIFTGTADFVLELFLPMDCKDHEEQKEMLTSLSVIIQRVCRTLRVVTNEELKEEAALPTYSFLAPLDAQATKGGNTLESTGKDIPPVVQQNGTDFSMIQKENVTGDLVEQSLDFRQDNLKPSDKESFECAEQCPTFAKGSFSSVSTGKTRDKKHVKAEKTITLDVLRQQFAGSLKDAAKNLGVCPTTLKRICRQHGINRWPSRKIKKVGHSLQKLQHVIDSVQGASGAIQNDSLFLDLASPNVSASSPIADSKLNDTQQQIGAQPVGGVHFSPPAAESKSPSSSCSQGSSSSQCFSSGRQQNPSACNAINVDDPLISENAAEGLLKRVRSDVELHGSNQELKRHHPRSQSHVSVNEIRNTGTILPSMNHVSPETVEGEALRVKVTYANEKIRFQLQNNWGLKHLWHEITRRFNIDDMSKFDLKYLDDDSEWVLLRCDADLDECRDVWRSSQRNTVKLSIELSHHYRLGS